MTIEIPTTVQSSGLMCTVRSVMSQGVPSLQVANRRGAMDTEKLGVHFEREIRDQPFVWERIAASDKAAQLARALDDDDVVLVGSGSSLFVAELAALALRRRRISAQALAAT